MVSTPQEAEELVAFLNYCGMDEFTGVRWRRLCLTPPHQLPTLDFTASE